MAGLATVPLGEEVPASLLVAGSPFAATNSGVSRHAIRSLPPPISTFRAYSGSLHRDRNAELLEGPVERRQVAVPLGVCEHTVAVEDERGHPVTRPYPRCRTSRQSPS